MIADQHRQGVGVPEGAGLPDLFHAVVGQAVEPGPAAVLDQKPRVVEHGGMRRLLVLLALGMLQLPEDLAAARVEPLEVVVRDGDQLLPAAQLDEHRRLVAHRVVARGPLRLSGGAVEGGHRVALAPGGDDHVLAGDDRRGGVAVERHRRIFFAELCPPLLLPVLERQRDELARGAERVDRALADGRRADRPVVGAVVPGVPLAQLVAPQLVAAGQVERRHHVDLSGVEHRHRLAVGDPDVRVARAQRASPGDPQPEGPVGKVAANGRPLGRRTSELGPAGCLLGEHGRRRSQHQRTAENRKPTTEVRHDGFSSLGSFQERAQSLGAKPSIFYRAPRAARGHQER